MEVEESFDIDRWEFKIRLNHAQALDLLAVLAQTPIAFFDDDDSAVDMSNLHKLLKAALKGKG